MDPFPGITYKRKRVGSATTTSIDDLNDDQLIEILVKLPLDCVHRSKCVSKGWLRLISDPCFIRSYIHCRSNLPQREQFILYQIIVHSISAKSCVYGHVPMPQIIGPSSSNSNNVIQHQISDHLDAKFFDFKFRRCPFKLRCLRSFEVERISHGLLLCKAEYKPVGCKPPKVGVYYVCNPLTKQWVKIPPLHGHRRRWRFRVWPVGFMCYALDQNVPHMIDFTVLEVGSKSKQNNSFDTHVFSSRTGYWRTYRVAHPPNMDLQQPWAGPPNYGSVVVYRGMFHWSGGSWLVAYDPQNEPYKCNLIPIPISGASNHYSQLVVSGGHIRLVTCRPPMTELCVNELTDYDNCEWCVKYVVTIPPQLCEVAFFSQTHEEIACIIQNHYTKKDCYTKKFELLDMKSGSVLSRTRNIPAEPIGFTTVALPYSMTSWPTILTKIKFIPIKDRI